MKKDKYKDFFVKTNNPIMADGLLQQFGVLMAGGGKNDENSYVKDSRGFYKARCLGDLEYVKFVVENQGYRFIELKDDQRH